MTTMASSRHRLSAPSVVGYIVPPVIRRVSGKGRPLVAIHGFGVDHRILLRLEEMVGTAEWRRIYVDLPWVQGAASVEVTSTQEVADGVQAEVREHLGDEPFAVIGSSFGGMIARYLAHELRDQVLGLATIAGVVEASHDRRILPPRQVVHSDADVVASAGEVRDDFEAVSVVQTVDALAAFNDHVLPGLRAADPAVMERIASSYALRVEPEAAHPEPFQGPALHIFGRQDDVVGYEDGWRLRDHYVRGTYAVLDAAGHNVHLEQPGIAAALIQDWLSRMSIPAH